MVMRNVNTPLFLRRPQFDLAFRSEFPWSEILNLGVKISLNPGNTSRVHIAFTPHNLPTRLQD